MKMLLLFFVLAAPFLNAPEYAAATAQGKTPSECGGYFRAAMHRMHNETSQIPIAADSDADFVKLMIPHHQAALEMAQTELLCSRDPQLRRMAQEIITDQQLEIDLMRLWLKKHTIAAH
jgi:uncharacterized protein (DUF305 family)